MKQKQLTTGKAHTHTHTPPESPSPGKLWGELEPLTGTLAHEKGIVEYP